jgi:hypothetical protein
MLTGAKNMKNDSDKYLAHTGTKESELTMQLTEKNERMLQRD